MGHDLGWYTPSAAFRLSIGSGERDSGRWGSPLAARNSGRSKGSVPGWPREQQLRETRSFRMSSNIASDPRIDLLRPYFTAALRGGSVDELVADSLRKLDEWHGVRIMEAWHKLNDSRPQRSAVQ